MKNQNTLSRFICFIMVSAGVLALTGCGKKPESTAQASPSTAALEKQLLTVAQSIDRSLNALAVAQQTANPPLLNTAPLVTPEGGLGGTADIDWSGPVAPLLNKIAKMSEYRLKVLGKEPPVPIIVSITEQKAVLADIIKNAGLQSGRRANIMVYPANRIIELRYAS